MDVRYRPLEGATIAAECPILQRAERKWVTRNKVNCTLPIHRYRSECFTRPLFCKSSPGQVPLLSYRYAGRVPRTTGINILGLEDPVLMGECRKEKERMSQSEASFLFAHQANIEKYEKFLQTYLTDHERVFIQRRLKEERQAIARLVKTGAA